MPTIIHTEGLPRVAGEHVPEPEPLPDEVLARVGATVRAERAECRRAWRGGPTKADVPAPPPPADGPAEWRPLAGFPGYEGTTDGRRVRSRRRLPAGASPRELRASPAHRSSNPGSAYFQLFDAAGRKHQVTIRRVAELAAAGASGTATED